MHILHINSTENVDKIDKFIEQGKDVFILVYMEGCGPCNATRPEWEKIDSVLKEQYSNKDNLVVIDVNKDFLSKIKKIGPVEGFPTMKYIGNYGKKIESYENSSVKKKDRSLNSFISWIEFKINNTISESSPNNVYNRLTKKQNNKKNTSKRRHSQSRKQKGGKWSRKYKLSINCKRPKGFSQRQYCKYGRNKN
jgi:thiol-disulfide isomerase/thioredoxin